MTKPRYVYTGRNSRHRNRIQNILLNHGPLSTHEIHAILKKSYPQHTPTSAQLNNFLGKDRRIIRLPHDEKCVDTGGHQYVIGRWQHIDWREPEGEEE